MLKSILALPKEPWQAIFYICGLQDELFLQPFSQQSHIQISTPADIAS